MPSLQFVVSEIEDKQDSCGISAIKRKTAVDRLLFGVFLPESAMRQSYQYSGRPNTTKERPDYGVVDKATRLLTVAIASIISVAKSDKSSG